MIDDHSPSSSDAVHVEATAPSGSSAIPKLDSRIVADGFPMSAGFPNFQWSGAMST
jgi:hypothetical protein